MTPVKKVREDKLERCIKKVKKKNRTKQKSKRVNPFAVCKAAINKKKKKGKRRKQ